MTVMKQILVAEGRRQDVDRVHSSIFSLLKGLLELEIILTQIYELFDVLDCVHGTVDVK